MKVHPAILGCGLLLLGAAALAPAASPPPIPQQMPGPKTPAERDTWLADLRRWRTERLAAIGYDGSLYARDDLKWSQRNLIQPQMMVEDRYFYDPVAGRYTVDRYLDDLERRYGGIDSVLVWAVYTNIGIDDRNQFDMVRCLPGGTAGVRQMVADFHRRGVKVFFPTMKWDTGTRDEGAPDWIAFAALMKEVGADGVNGDTFRGVARDYFDASLAVQHPLVIEPEVGVESDQQLGWNLQTWGYWRDHPFIPSISRYKWLEPRHMINVCARWERDKTDTLHQVFFNGVGYETWENVWGIWNQLTPRAAETVRRISKIFRATAELLVSPEWEPHVPTLQPGVFATRFPGRTATLWTLVNNGAQPASGPQLEVACPPGTRFYDLWHGVEITPAKKGDGTAGTLSFDLEALGYGAILATDRPAGLAPLPRLLADMKALAAQPLNELSNEWHFLPQQIVEIPATKPATAAPPGMLKIPGGQFVFKVSGIEIEGSTDVGVDVQYPWETWPGRYHNHLMAVAPFYMDRFPVTNAEFKRFLDATRYAPRDALHFLRDWKNGTYPEGWGNKPVTWVSLEDARAFAAWAGKRLPHEWEWQFAAQGTDGRVYPWGEEWNPAAAPEPDHGRVVRPPADVDAHPLGASPFGVRDLVGNVWQWTDEFVDEHTRAAIVRGGGHYRSDGSKWYFPNSPRNDQHGKYLLMAPAKDRSGGIGFRCVVDAER